MSLKQELKELVNQSLEADKLRLLETKAAYRFKVDTLSKKYFEEAKKACKALAKEGKYRHVYDCYERDKTIAEKTASLLRQEELDIELKNGWDGDDNIRYWIEISW